MKNRKLLTSYISFLISFFLFSNVLFAKSENHITVVKTVGQNAILSEGKSALSSPELIIHLVDGLKEGDRFYLRLIDAVWRDAPEAIRCLPMATKNENGETSYSIASSVLSPTEMEICVQSGSIAPGSNLTIPLETIVKGERAQIQIDSNNTTISSEALTFANISSDKLKLSPIEPAEKVLEEGFLPKLQLEEIYGGQVRHFAENGMKNTFIIRLDSTDFEFDITPDATLVGTKAFEGILGDSSCFKILNSTQLQITLPEAINTISTTNKGGFLIDGIKIKTTSRTPQSQVVNASIEGDMVKSENFTALALGDFIVHLIVPSPQAVLSGTNKQLTFTLQEDIQDSLLRNRPLTVSIDNGVHIPVNDDGLVPVTIEDETYLFEALMEDYKCIGFTIPSLTYEQLKDTTDLTFTFNTTIPANTFGNITLSLEGRALHTPLSATVFDVQSPVTVEIEGIKAKSGLKDQFGGSIRITENTAHALQQGKKLFISLDTDSLQITTPPIVTVTKGDLQVGSPVIVPGGIEIPVISHSTVPSTLAIKHFGLTLDGTVAAGKYEVAVGGPALSVQSGAFIDMSQGFKFIDPIIVHNQFVLVDTEALENRVITFKLGEESYNLNGQYHHLDTPAYLDNGRVMVPIRYVAEALGIPADQTKFDAVDNVFTLYTDKIIEIKVNSNELTIDGIPSLMSTDSKQVGKDIMVPMSEIANALDIEVSWDATLETATFIQYGI